MLGGDFAQRGADGITMAAEAQTNHQVRPMTLGSESQPKQAVWLRLQAIPIYNHKRPRKVLSLGNHMCTRKGYTL